MNPTSKDVRQNDLSVQVQVMQRMQVQATLQMHDEKHSVKTHEFCAVGKSLSKADEPHLQGFALCPQDQVVQSHVCL